MLVAIKVEVHPVVLSKRAVSMHALQAFAEQERPCRLQRIVKVHVTRDVSDYLIDRAAHEC